MADHTASLPASIAPQALQHVMEGCGEAFRPHLDDSLRALIYRALAHPNRFIRCGGKWAAGS